MSDVVAWVLLLVIVSLAIWADEIRLGRKKSANADEHHAREMLERETGEIDALFHEARREMNRAAGQEWRDLVD